MIGRRLSHYDIVEEISRGGMGVVYRAVDVNLGRDVAVKVLPEDAVRDEDRRERLLREARAASALEHPHIAVIHEVGEADGVTFIAMELIRGEKLSEVIARAPLPQARALSLAIEIAEGLARAHDRGIVHRDLKPANVMVTEEGHAKIIDFGLAKVAAPVVQDAATVTAHGPRTQPGVVLGTAAYMSPEQARGGSVDHRSDIFALGVTLYEMVAGRPAFHGRSGLETMQAILTQPVPPLPATPDAPEESIAALQRIVDKCTAKEAEERYQGMKDLVVDLRAARRRLESSSHAALGSASRPAPSARPRSLSAAVAAVVVLLAIVAAAAVTFWWGQESAAPGKSSGKRAVAVLYFENNTGDASLDWMRTGLTDMLVTDLSQSPEIEVLGTDRLVRVLEELERIDDRVISAEVVQEIARRARVDNVLLGSYVKAGDAIRISARLQEADSGRILSAERVEGTGESSVFQLVDELTRRLKSRLAALGATPEPLVRAPGPTEGGRLDRDVSEVTTASVEAYRHYAQGIHFHDRGLSAQAEPFLRQAVEIDPDFAMALAKLAVVHHNLANFEQRDAYARQALDRAQRLTSRERYYIEGFYYGLRPQTIARSIEAYSRGLALHPEHQASRHNLALHLYILERFAEGIAQSEELIRRGTSNPTTYENLADMLLQSGNVTRARQVAEEFVGRYPDNGAGFRALGMTLIADGRLDEARSAFEKSHAFNPSDFAPRLGRRNIAILQGRWSEVDEINADVGRGPAPFLRFLGIVGKAFLAGMRGQGQGALDALQECVDIPDLPPFARALARNRRVRLLERMDRHDRALAEAQRALSDARGTESEFEALQLLATMQAAAGKREAADATLIELEGLAKTLPSDRELRRVHWTRSEFAAMRGDHATAADEMARALSLLPANGPPIGPPSSHSDLFLAAAHIYLKAGRDAEAARWLERLQNGYERAFGLDAYGRALYLLGEIYERRGDKELARAQYTRFLALWHDGDLERDWVARAQKKVAVKP